MPKKYPARYPIANTITVLMNQINVMFARVQEVSNSKWKHIKMQKQRMINLINNILGFNNKNCINTDT